MYSYIKGKVTQCAPGRMILENSGVGYDISVPDNDEYAALETENEYKIWTYLSVSQDAVSLYGFLTERECGLFKMLITVSGIGPKGAMQILGSLGADNLVLAVMQEDDALISTAQGIGKKTARKLIIELKDRITGEELESAASGISSVDTVLLNGDAGTEAFEALVSLGYSRNEAMSAVKGTGLPGDASVEEILKEALKRL